MRFFLVVAMIGIVSGWGLAEQRAPELNLMPMPASVRVGNGALEIAPTFSVGIDGYREPRLERAVERFCRELSRRTGFFISAEIAEPSKATLVIHAERASKAVQELGEDESYVLDVRGAGAKIAAANPLGVMHGMETFLQLVAITPSGFVAPFVHIEDSPRFPWRGLTIDVSRHFIYLDTLKRNIDGMAAVKMNVLHLHLSDDQGFRVESREFPKLQKLGSDGLYYTQAEMRELIEYARDRGIRILPEFDMPGHSTAWFVGYPDLASGPGPYSIERRWGIFDPAMDPSRESTFKFLDKLIGEMAELFPDHFFHIGGDEVNGKQWDANPEIQKFMRAHKLKNDRELQQYFTLEVQKLVSKHHKEMVGWDEILAPGMPKDIVIQSWRGQESLAEAARQGYRGILSSGYYLDGMAPASQHYAVDPMANADATLTPEQQKLILGGEACMWAEFISDENVDSRIWPRAAAVAERLWSAQDVRDPDSMYRRLNAVNVQLEELGLKQRSSTGVMLARMAGSDDIASLRVLVDAVQPASITIREKEAEAAGGIQTSDIPLNRMVDAAAPESEMARRFSGDVDQFVASKFQDAAAEARIRAQLVLWRDNDAQLQPLLQNSFLLKELTPVSQNLTTVAAAGLMALDYMDKGQPATDSWHREQSALILQAEKPTADLILAVTPAVQKLVDASVSISAATRR
ncbi:MAG: family 20 glycosylhydrolase [Candidatus Acidiferrales bacterium]